MCYNNILVLALQASVHVPSICLHAQLLVYVQQNVVATD